MQEIEERVVRGELAKEKQNKKKRWRGPGKKGGGARGAPEHPRGRGKAGRERRGQGRDARQRAAGFGRPISGVCGKPKTHSGRGIHADAERRGQGALTGNLGLTSPLQKWQKNRCAATAAPEPAPAAEASAIFLFRRGGPRGQPACPSPGRYLPAAVAASAAASSARPAVPEPASVT